MAQAQVIQYLGALPVFARIDSQTQKFIGLDGVCALILQGVRADLVENPDAPAFLLLIDYSAPAFFLNHQHRAGELFAAIAFRGRENIAGHPGIFPERKTLSQGPARDGRAR